MTVTLFPLSPLYSLLIGDCSTPLSIQSASSLHKVTSGINTSSFTHDYHNFEKNQKITLFNFRCSNVAEVRLLRFWEARNLTKGGELMSVDMLFVDENVSLFFHESVLQFTSSRFFNLTQGTVSANRHLRFRERLSEGSLYTLTGFDVVRRNTNFRLFDAPFSIRFNEGISLEKVTVSARPISMELFRFMAYSQILEFVNTGRQLPDAIGEVNAIRSTIPDRLPGAQRVMLTLRLRIGENVCVRMFDSLALAFHTKLDSYGREPRVVIATSVNPKKVGGRLFLNGTFGTHLYLDSETAAGKEVFDMGCQGAGDCFISGVDDLLYGVATKSRLLSFYTQPKLYRNYKQMVLHLMCQVFRKTIAPNASAFNVLRFGCIVAFDAAMTKVTNVRAMEVPHPMGQGEEQDPRNPSKKVWT
ncbi:hypothetical protein Bca101_036884 [Brassica carinata]